MEELIFKDEVYAIVGAAFEVHKEMGRGFLEPVYQDALAVEFQSRGIPFEKECWMSVRYKQRELKRRYRADFVCYQKIVVELKALERLSGNEQARIINYLKASDTRVAVLLNFGRPSLEWRRFVG